MQTKMMAYDRVVTELNDAHVKEIFLSIPFQVLASCDKCNFNCAFFYQLQIRFADEPMATCAISIVSISLFLDFAD